MKYKAGFGKHETTSFIPGIGMMGHGQPQNTVKEVAPPLFSRAMFLQDELQKKFILVHLKQAFVTIENKEEIIKRLGVDFFDCQINDANLMITAQ